MDTKSLERRFKILTFLYMQLGVENDVLEKLSNIFDNGDYVEFESRITEIEEKVIDVLEH